MSRGKGTKTVALESAIIDVLDAFDGPMSPRQVFYQCVSRGAVANNAKENGRVQRAVLALRREGLVPQGRIVDRTRRKHHQQGWDGAEDLIAAASEQYRRDSWVDADVVPMIACEKQALEGVFSAAVDAWGVSLWTLRGFASESFAFEWAEEVRALVARGKVVWVSYFGDFDPSGLAIEADARAKLARFGAHVRWRRDGLLEHDLKKFDLVRLPVKRSDSRAKAFLSTFGPHGAELDALPPRELVRRIDDAISEHIDADRWDAIRRVEAAERETLDLVTKNWDAAVAAARAA